ncbi:MAG: RecX family transcriptional regulator [Clostridiaceae bacterium]|nr:RecX family transcriptional regulator [Clostridiaceae bacterium]
MSQSEIFEEARKKAAAFIGIDHAKSSGRVRRNLLRKGVDPKTAEQVVAYFIGIDYINDERAAAAVAARYRGRKTRSRRSMVGVLIQNGIEPRVAEAFVLRLDEDRDTAARLCQQVCSDPSPDLETDLMKLLTRRGYPAGLAREVIKNLLES